jgi:hypothetical protein
MKNILAENLLRFGVKNLSKTQLSELSKIVEQQDTPRGNITLNTDLLSQAFQAPQVIKDPYHSYSAFVTRAKTEGAGIPGKGDVAVINGNAMIVDLGAATGGGSNVYVIVGRIGELDDKLTVQNIKDAYYVFTMNPAAGQGFGNLAIKLAGPINPQNPIDSIARICKLVDKRNPLEFYTRNSKKLKDIFSTNIAMRSGTDVELLKRVDVDKLITNLIVKPA